MSQASFSQLNLPASMLSNLDRLGYKHMTDIQQHALPEVLAGHDLIAKAKTGSGKTAAFGLGLLVKLRTKQYRPQGIVLCPTRELATQVANELRKLAQFKENIKILTLCGGQPIGPQIGSLEHGAQIIVGTPGRIKDHLRKNTLALDEIHTVILDEADRMLDMGFADDIRHIIGHTPKKRQTLLFSATYPDTIAALSADILYQPKTVEVAAIHEKSKIEQRFFEVDKSQRLEAFGAIVNQYQPEFAVIFCNTKQSCNDVQQFLRQQGFQASAIHGELDQRDRDQVLVKFANRSLTFLIATDVAARGLDIDDLPCVINYEMTRDVEVHTHRIGRTGRAGKSGVVFNLFQPSEVYKAIAVGDRMGCDINPTPLDIHQFSFDTPHTSDADTERKAKQPPMVTLAIAGGKKNKIRPGDILGALTGSKELNGQQIGKINIFDFVAYVAVERKIANKAFNILSKGKIKARSLKVRRV